MQIYFSASSKGFFNSDIHGKNIPEDAVPITEDEHAQLIAEQGNGATIGADESSRPVIIKKTSEELLSSARAAKKAQINIWREEALRDGFGHNGEIYQADPVSYTNLIGVTAAISSGLTLPSNFLWRTADDNNVSMDNEALIALGAAMLSYVNGCYQKSWALKAAVDECEDIEQLDLIIW